MVLFGEPIEKVLEETQDPVFKKFWEEKDVVPYKPFPYDRLKDVYEGNSVMIEYSGFVNNMVRAGFMMPDGEALVHVPTTSLGFNISSITIWAFHPLNPWLHRFEPFMRAFHEMGRIEELQNIAMWALNSWQFYTATFRTENVLFYSQKQIDQWRLDLAAQSVITPAQEKMRTYNQVEVPLKMADFAGVFGIFWITLPATVLVYVVEWSYWKKVCGRARAAE